MINCQSFDIIKAFKRFLQDSCTPDKELSYSSLHRGIIKMYFGARDVDIDYKTSLIKAEIPKSDLQYTLVSFEFEDLDEFLSSCIENDKRSLNFYQSVLKYYNIRTVG